MKKFFIILTFLLAVFSQAYAEDAADVALVKQGNALYKEGRLDESIDVFKKAIKANPSNFFAYMNCGYAYAAKGDNKTALTYLEKAYSLQPEDELKKGIERLKLLEEGEYFKTGSSLRFNKKAGFNISGLSSDTDSYGLKTGLCAGLEAIYGFGELISFQGGLLYTQKGAHTSLGTYVNLDYIEIPAMLKVSFRPVKELLTGAYFGGSAAVRISAKHKVSGVEEEHSPEYGLFDCGLLGGVEATYPLFGLFWINADLRFSQGMIDILNDTSEKLSNSVFTASFGIIF